MAGITPGQSVRRGLRVDDAILQFEFKPSIGISARAIDKLEVDIRSFREPLKRVVQQVMAPSFKKNFDQGGRPDGWAPLSDATHEIRERLGKGGGGKILNRTGLLMKTISQLNVWTITTETATIRALPDKVKYGGIHQEGFGGKGTSRKMGSYLKKAKGDAKEAQKLLDDDLIMAMRSGKKVGGGQRGVASIPARPFVMVQDDDYDDIEKIFVDWLEERVRDAGFKKGGA
jgi:phage gpG-like protein